MKTTPLTCCIILLGAFSLSGCDPRQSELTAQSGSADRKAPASTNTVTPAADTLQSNDPVAAALADLKTISYETRGTATSVMEKMDGQVTALMAQWVAAGRKFSRESEAQYQSKHKELKEKISALSFATPETWNTAKDAATVALENVRGALHALDTSAK